MTYDPISDTFVRGYWYYRPADGFPPPPTFEITPSFSEPTLCLAGVPGSPPLSTYQERKIITGWADVLPSLESVEMLWIAPKVNQLLLDAICSMPNLVGLHIKHSSITTIPPTAFGKLRFLHLGSSPGLTDVDGISSHHALEWLETENLKRVTNISPISQLTSLVGLAIDGSTWTTQRVDSLAPLANLTQLRFLSLINTRVTDASLRPLHCLTRLEAFRHAKWWPDEEVQSLLEANPRLRRKNAK
jgi:Leucine-rich repeat (LRR) protein